MLPTGVKWRINGKRLDQFQVQRHPLKFSKFQGGTYFEKKGHQSATERQAKLEPPTR